jgi:hypothetical protein
MTIRWSLLLLSVSLLLVASPANAAFHVMQIEQVVGGLNGNPAAQAIQLRLRSASQNQVQLASLWAADAAGANRILLLNIASPVSNSAIGAHILLTTSAFNSAMVAGGAATFTPDFTLANSIPSSYLSAGRLTFEADGGSVATPGTIYWSLSWGGASYMGSNTGDLTNDADGNFGPAFGSTVPTSILQGLIFTGTSTAPSTTNLANYAFTSSPATVTKNSGASFTVVAPPFLVGDYNRNGLVDANDYAAWRQTFGSIVSGAFSNADGSGNGTIDAPDFVIWRKRIAPGGAGIGTDDYNPQMFPNVVPEPATIAMFMLAIFVFRSQRRWSRQRLAKSGMSVHLRGGLD